ncbi:APH domain-containing protein [Fusarium keratoplasticum]|nr:APH domain-containing protein [Fusarium keratoplasticum]
MASTASIDVDAKVQRALVGTKFEPSSLTKLSGGSVNWIYLVKLSTPLDDGTTEVLVKHGEPWMASKPEFPLPLLRCSIEMESLRVLSGRSSFGRSASTDIYTFVARTPNFFHFDDNAANQILEFLPDGINLKDYVLQHYNAPTPKSFEPQCRHLGKALGKWLRGFIDWTTRQVKHRHVVAQSDLGQEIKHMVNFLWLYERIKDFPDILDPVKDILGQVEQMAAAETKEVSKHQIIHGDFWTGNIILPNAPIQQGTEVPMLVIDWESTQLGLPSADFGQMIAEMYALWLYKSITAGLWMMEGFIDAYGNVSQDFAFRTAIQTGAHLLCITTTFPGWGTPEQQSTAPRSTVTVTAKPDPTPKAECDFADGTIYWEFLMSGIFDWADDGGKKLKEEESGCGALTNWKWLDGSDHNQGHQASFRLPFFMKSGCVERAIVSAGGPKI